MIKVGDRFETNSSGSCIVIKYIDCNDVRVRFDDGTETTCQASQLRNGLVKNPNHPSVCNIGFIGIGIYFPKTHLRIYKCWKSMLGRCYNEDTQLKQPSYIGCAVCERWWNFQNFAHDYLQMFGSDLDWQLDKDILFKHNEIYSPETCCLLPQEINKLLIKRDANRGECCIGVTYYEGKPNPYQARCSIKGKNKYLGYYKTEQEAYLAYKVSKEAEIRRLANFYKDQLDLKVYLALINYVVEPND
jgi:hypothetical protein